MLASRNGDVFSLRVTEEELAFLTEGIYAVRDAGVRCLEGCSLDQADCEALEIEIDFLSAMLSQLEAARE